MLGDMRYFLVGYIAHAPLLETYHTKSGMASPLLLLCIVAFLR